MRKPAVKLIMEDNVVHEDLATFFYVSHMIRCMFNRVDEIFQDDFESNKILVKRVVELLIVHDNGDD